MVINLDVDRRRREQEIEQLNDFIADNKPHAIVLGAGPGEVSATRFFKELENAAQWAMRHKNLRHNIHVTWADSRVAKIFKNSSRSKKEFPDYLPAARFAFALVSPFLTYTFWPLTEKPSV